MRRALVVVALALGCADRAEPSPTPTAPAVVSVPTAHDEAARGVKAFVDREVDALLHAVEDLRDAAPAPDDDGWSVSSDPEAVAAMRAAWRRARVAYEHVEGAIAILFPETDIAIDARFEREAELRLDARPFDGHGFVGMHAVERILWADHVAPSVDRFERALPGYLEARTPRSSDEARDFREGLCQRLVTDVRQMRDGLAPVALDDATAWRGIEGSVEEQSEKVLLGTTGQDESRYAAVTLADMRANLEGARAVLDAFDPLLAAHPEAAAHRSEIRARLAELEAAYDTLDGDALPDAPEAFDPDRPSEAHLATPYGRLFALLGRATSPRVEGTLSALLRTTGRSMGISPLSRP